MPIYDQSFRHYDGPRSTGRLWWPVATQTLRSLFKTKWAWFPMMALVIQVAVFSFAMFGVAKVRSLDPNNVRDIERALKQAGMPLTTAMESSGLLYILLQWAWFVFWFMPLLGQGCISIDKKNSALPLYFSRPLTVRDYLVGKILGLSMPAFLALFVAITIVFAQAVAYFYSAPQVAEELLGVGKAVLMALVSAVLVGLSMAAFSSSTSNPRVAATFFIMFWFASSVLTAGLSDYMRIRELAALGPRHALAQMTELLMKPTLMLPGQQYDVIEFGWPYALASIVGWGLVFLWVAWRNLRVVEVVK